MSAGVRLSSVSLAHIDNSFVYPGSGNYQGLLKEIDLTEEALSRREEVGKWIAAAQTVAVLTEEPQVETGPQCGTPFACGFCKYCNRDKVWPEYPISALPKLSKRRKKAVEATGCDDLREIPDALLTPIQLRVKQCSVSGQPFFDSAGAAADLAPHGFPAYFLDFETAMFAVPVWTGTRPYQQIPFQFSLHILHENGELEHVEFLDLSGNDPSLDLATSLTGHCGDRGPVFVYSAKFEKDVMGDLAARFSNLAPALGAIIGRVIDLLPVARRRFYHPRQMGRWSIKNVLPAAIPELSYDQLDGVHDGGMAVAAFMEAIAPNTTAERKREINTQLLSYCRLDTFAMVRIHQFLSGPKVAAAG